MRDPIKLQFLTRPVEAEWVVAVELAEDTEAETIYEVRANVNVPARIINDAMNELSSARLVDQPSAIGDVSMAWQNLREKIIHPSDIEHMMDVLNVSAWHLDLITHSCLSFLNSLSIPDADKDDKSDE